MPQLLNITKQNLSKIPQATLSNKFFLSCLTQFPDFMAPNRTQLTHPNQLLLPRSYFTQQIDRCRATSYSILRHKLPTQDVRVGLAAAAWLFLIMAALVMLCRAFGNSEACTWCILNWRVSLTLKNSCHGSKHQRHTVKSLSGQRRCIIRSIRH